MNVKKYCVVASIGSDLRRVISDPMTRKQANTYAKETLKHRPSSNPKVEKLENGSINNGGVGSK